MCALLRFALFLALSSVVSQAYEIKARNFSGTNVVVAGYVFPSGFEGSVDLPAGEYVVAVAGTNYNQLVESHAVATFNELGYTWESQMGVVAWYSYGFGFAGTIAMVALGVRMLRVVGGNHQPEI